MILYSIFYETKIGFLLKICNTFIIPCKKFKIVSFASQFSSLNFVYLCCTDICELKKLYQAFSLINYLLLSLGSSILYCNNFIIYYITWFFQSTKTAFNLPTAKSSTFVFKVFKLNRTLVSLWMSSLSTLAFEAIKSFLAEKSDASTPVACPNSF